MVKEINENWANEILKGNREMQKNNESTKAIEFIKNNNYVLQFDLKRFTCDYLKAVDIFKNNIIVFSTNYYAIFIYIINSTRFRFRNIISLFR